MSAGPRTSAVAALLGLGAVVLVAGCASRTEVAGGRTSSPSPSVSVPASVPVSVPVTRRTTACQGRGSGFALSLAGGFKGAPDPVGAARSFVRNRTVPGFGTVVSVWVPATPGHRAHDAVTLTDGRVSLRAVRLPDRTWAIDSGSRCA